MTETRSADQATDSLPEWLAGELGTVPSYPAFAGVDELHARLHRLAAAHRDVAELHRCGTSRQGDPLWALTVHRRPGEPEGSVPEALAYGLPHPNEPIGGLTALHLAERLCTDAGLRERLGHRWRIVDCIDPDGLRLNEGWLAGPFDRATYAEHFYRPAGRDQVEWTFPIRHQDAYFDDALPETLALMRLIDEHRPRLVASLHNSELGGAYYWLNRAEPALHPVLQGLPGTQGIPLDRGEPEAAHLKMLGDAIYEASPLPEVYASTLEREKSWVQRGGSATWYADRWGALMLVSELPYWHDPHAADQSPSGITYRDALAANASRLVDLGELLERTLADVSADLLAPDSPLWRAARFFGGYVGPTARSRLARSELASSDRPASVAEATSLAGNVHEQRLRFGGLLLRALRGEVALGNVRRPVRAALAELEREHAVWLEEDAAALAHEPIEIRRLVAVQYGATLAAAAHLSGNLR